MQFRERILAWIIQWLISNLDKETVDKLMRERVLPFLRSQKAKLYSWVDELAKSTESDVDDVAAQVLKYVLDALLPDAA